MDQFDIIGALEAHALANKWLFVYGVDDFYKSAQTVQQYDNGQLIMVADFRAQPTIVNGRITEISYTCLIMLGRKFDTDGQAADLNEDSKQKYDRRLKELMQLLAQAIAQVACGNDLEVTVGDMIVEINLYSENIDFAASPNTVFVQ